MSTDIDIKSYAGEQTDSAAVNHENIAVNSYQNGLNEEFPVQQELVDQIKEEAKDLIVDASKMAEDHIPDVTKKVEEAPSKQELNFKALREEIDRAKTERDELKQNLEILRANVASKPQELPKERSMFEGLQKDDIPNVGDIERVFKEREEAYQARIEELQVAQQYPDYAEVIEKFALPLVKQKPHLAEGIQGARNKALFAYELGKMAQQMNIAQQPKIVEEAPTQKTTIAQKIVENARKPGTLSQAGGSGSLSKADYYASMSDAEFAKFASKNFD
jgi:hypothetical protein